MLNKNSKLNVTVNWVRKTRDGILDDCGIGLGLETSASTLSLRRTQ